MCMLPTEPYPFSENFDAGGTITGKAFADLSVQVSKMDP